MKGIVILVIVFFVLTGVLCFAIFYKGGQKKIHISRKYIENAPDDKKSIDGKNYIVECKYGNNNDKIHKLKCTKEMYDKFRMGNDYTVVLKSSRIAKIVK